MSVLSHLHLSKRHLQGSVAVTADTRSITAPSFTTLDGTALRYHRSYYSVTSTRWAVLPWF